MYWNIACTTDNSGQQADNKQWLFDSGCSKYMTEAQENLFNLEKMSAGKINFGDET